MEPVQGGNLLCSTTFYKNRKKKWAHSEKKDKNKCPFLKWWDLLFVKTHTFFTCDANAANYDFLRENIGCMKFFIIFTGSLGDFFL